MFTNGIDEVKRKNGTGMVKIKKLMYQERRKEMDRKSPGALIPIGWKKKQNKNFNSCIGQRRLGRAGRLRNAREADGILVPWHHSTGDNLHSAYGSTISITKIMLSLQHTS